MKKIYITLIALLSASILFAQTPVPAKKQSKSIVLMGATAHLGDGTVIENAAIGFKDGTFNLIADARTIRLASDAYDTIINLNGKHVYPGLIAANTVLGIREIGAVRATSDHREVGGVNPSARSLIAYSTDSRVTPTVRYNGVMLAEVTPQGGLVSGSSSVMKLDGWNYEDAILKSDIGIHVNWPRMRVRDAWWAPKPEVQRKRTAENLAQLHQLFNDAYSYYKTDNKKQANQHFEAMNGLFDGSKKLFVHADYIKEIISAVNFANKYQIKLVIVGGTDALMASDLLKENNVPVVLEDIHRVPSRTDQDIDMPYRLPALLKEAGVEFCVSAPGFWQVRNLPFHAGTTAAYGLTKEEALQTITAWPAKILGIDDVCGTLTENKQATLIVSSGDVLDMRTSVIEMAFIQGMELDLVSIQTEMNEKFLGKFGLE
ncbi:MAG: amidohydrolase family protein [Bacteroidia bacterium]|nr:amidohydrolase family protein [Bacteroidia bacterium]NNC84761.1 amidohydrolase family protein [Bacteroidia bacterium]NNM16393.1 amidohydrolase family protein [Bacteroidia bacterium]